MQTLVSLLVLLLGVNGHDENLDDSLAERLPMTSERRRPWAWSWEIRGPCHTDGRIYFPLNDIGETTETTSQACKERCQSTDGCAAFNFLHAENMGREGYLHKCWLSSGTVGGPWGHHWAVRGGEAPDGSILTERTLLSGPKHCGGSEQQTGTCDAYSLKFTNCDYCNSITSGPICNFPWPDGLSFSNTYCCSGCSKSCRLRAGFDWKPVAGLKSLYPLDAEMAVELKLFSPDDLMDAPCQNSALSTVQDLNENGGNPNPSGWTNSGSSFNFECDTGFSPFNGPALCANGVWTNLNFLSCHRQCHKSDLPLADVHFEGGLNSGFVNWDQEYWFECNSGFQIVKKPVGVGSSWYRWEPPLCLGLYSGPVGQWGPDNPSAGQWGNLDSMRCIRNPCTSTIELANGNNIYDSYYGGQNMFGGDNARSNRPTYFDVQASAHYATVCDEGFSPSVAEVECRRLQNGHREWSDTPTCVKKCDKSELGAIAHIENPHPTGWTISGSSFNFECDTGFSPSGGPALCSTGDWNLNDLRCNRIPCSTLELPNGVDIVDDESGTYVDDFTRSFVVECDQGYSESLPAVSCSRGLWSETPTCDGKSCGAFMLGNGHDIAQAAHGTSVSVECDPDHSASVAEISCTLGLWSESPTCYTPLPTPSPTGIPTVMPTPSPTFSPTRKDGIYLAAPAPASEIGSSEVDSSEIDSSTISLGF